MSAESEQSKQQPTSDDEIQRCTFCRREKPFDFPEAIRDAALDGNLVFFVGAGVSTEDRLASPTTFYEEINYQLGLTGEEKASFPTVMSRFCAPPRGRKVLFQAIKQRI